MESQHFRLYHIDWPRYSGKPFNEYIVPASFPSFFFLSSLREFEILDRVTKGIEKLEQCLTDEQYIPGNINEEIFEIQYFMAPLERKFLRMYDARL